MNRTVEDSKMTIAMVGYYNTLPMLKGLQENTDKYEVILDVPSRCMDYYIDGTTDVALVPVAALLECEEYELITDYCIGCDGMVKTVCVFANREISELKKIYLDSDSRTSQLLVRILCQSYWYIDPIFEQIDASESIKLKDGEGILMIGDKVFGSQDMYIYSYDLGVEWKRLTGLPFAFAVWIGRPGMDVNLISNLNSVFAIGVDDIDGVICDNNDLNKNLDLKKYFEQYIDYHFDDNKKKAFQLFLNLAARV